MQTNFPLVRVLFSLVALLVCPLFLGAGQGLVARWSFEDEISPIAHNSVSRVDDRIEGLYKHVPGISGTALRFDGYTTHIVCTAANAPKLGDGFSVEAWVAINTYPWNWVPVVDQSQFQQVGYFLGIDAYGHLGMQVAIDGVWQSVTSTVVIPLKRWAHIAGVFDEARGLVIYLDGKEVGRLAVHGRMTPADKADLLIGRVRNPLLPVPAADIHPKYPVWYSFDGILDEVDIYDRSLGPEEVVKSYAASHAPTGEVLPWPVLPSGPPGPGRFGAYYATLEFEDMWDRPRRIGPESDVVVRFDQAPVRLVFWQGTNYIPAWVTENNKWYSDEFVETHGPGCPGAGDCEPMSDKQSRYSHVRILESSPARVVVHWRYALSESMHYSIAHPDPLTGWGDWVDEYWTVYPDAVAVRKQVAWTSNLDNPFEWQESMIVNAPGERPEDSVNLDALTFVNMQGEAATYSWKPKPAGSFEKPKGPGSMDKPRNANIQWVNLRSDWKPFQVVAPGHVRFNFYVSEKTNFTFECWNHWPVSQIISSGRPCLTSDRTSSTSLSHIYWDTYTTTENSLTKLLLNGLTEKPAAELVPLAKSWLSPSTLEVAGAGLESQGYDPAQRAYVLARENPDRAASVELTFRASEESPVVNPALVIKSWGEDAVQINIDGKDMVQGKNLRVGYVEKLEGNDLVIWMPTRSTKPLRVKLSSAATQ